MVQYLVWLYMPNAKSYDFAGFTTTNISFAKAGLQGGTADDDKEAVTQLSGIIAHDQFFAVVPAETAPVFLHQFMNYAMSSDHPANVGIAIRAFIEKDTATPLPDQVGLKMERDTHTHHSIATLKLFKCQYVAFSAAAGSSYLLNFKVTGGNKFALGGEPGAPGDWASSFDRVVGRGELPGEHLTTIMVDDDS